jgi:dipeptidase E
VKLLLTSAGVKNPSIHAALLEMLGRPTAECSALAITTASYGHPYSGPGPAYSFISGVGSETPMVELGWKDVGVLELAALPSIDRERWMSWVREADVLLVNGGDALFLAHWMRESGLAALLPELTDLVWVGLSAGSMVLTPRIGPEFVEWTPPGGDGEVDDTTLGLVDFAIFPHLDYPGWDENTMAVAESWAAKIGVPSYAIDDQTAISVVDGAVEVISEGNWRRFEHSHLAG